MLWKNVRFLVTQNEDRTVREDIDLKIKGDKITQIADEISPEEDEKSVDCSDKIVLPGLVNAHTHVSMSLLRGISDDKKVQKWLDEDVLPAEEKMAHRHIKEGAVLGIKEMLKSGTTCFNDMYTPEKPVAEAVKDTGIRAVLSHGVVDLDEDPEDKAAQSRSFLEEFREDESINVATGPHSPYTCSEKLLKLLKSQSEEFDIPLHIHVSENQREVEKSKKEHGLTPVERLKEEEMLGSRTVAVHCTQLEEQDIQVLKEQKVNVVHCPNANLKLGSGVAPVPRMIDEGIRVALGTDGPASNNSLDMFEEMKTAALIQKNKDPGLMKAQEVLDMATLKGAEALGMPEVGSIEGGTKADVVSVSINDAMKPCRRENVVSNLVFSSVEVSDVVIDGTVVVQDKELKIDVSKEDSGKLSRDLW